MKRNVIAVAVAVAAFLVLSVASPVARQAQPRTESTSTLDAILAELRALRGEVNQAAGAGLRAQMLVARLALQEQRINVVGREISEIQEKLQANERNRPMADLLKSIGSGAGEGKSDEPPEANSFLEAIRGQAAQLDKDNEQLKARYAELSRVLAEEQARWTGFNAQLESLEQMLRGK